MTDFLSKFKPQQTMFLIYNDFSSLANKGFSENLLYDPFYTISEVTFLKLKENSRRAFLHFKKGEDSLSIPKRRISLDISDDPFIVAATETYSEAEILLKQLIELQYELLSDHISQLKSKVSILKEWADVSIEASYIREKSKLSNLLVLESSDQYIYISSYFDFIETTPRVQQFASVFKGILDQEDDLIEIIDSENIFFECIEEDELNKETNRNFFNKGLIVNVKHQYILKPKKNELISDRLLKQLITNQYHGTITSLEKYIYSVSKFLNKLNLENFYSIINLD